MNERWNWTIRYAVVIVLALILAAGLGEMALFKTTRFGKTGLSPRTWRSFLAMAAPCSSCGSSPRGPRLLFPAKTSAGTCSRASWSR